MSYLPEVPPDEKTSATFEGIKATFGFTCSAKTRM
jgi:hypothetical protein